LNSPTEAAPGDGQVNLARLVRNEAFAGDTGQLPYDTRRALVQLLSGPSVDGRRHAKLWSAVVRDETVIRSRLHDLFLELIVDRDQHVAFTRQVQHEDVEMPILLRRANLTFLETALLIYMRHKLTQADAQGERAVVARQELSDHLRVFERSNNVDRSKFDRNVEAAIEKAKKLSLLQLLRGASEERFEVSPTLKLLFPAEEIEALTRLYRAIGDASSAEDGSDARPSLAEHPADADGADEQGDSL
jgi:hypothetical protein